MRAALLCSVFLCFVVTAFTAEHLSKLDDYRSSNVNAVEDPVLSEIIRLYANGEYFRLRDLLTGLTDQDTPGALFAAAVVHHAFNRPAQSNTAIEQLMRTGPALPDTLVGDLRQLKHANYLRLYEYENALQALEEILAAPAAEVDSTTRADARGTLPLFEALAGIAPQQVEVQGETVVQMDRDMANLRRVDVRIGGVVRQYVLDTGAELSVVTRSEAEALGLTIREAGFEVTSSTGGKVLADVAVADEVLLGNVLYTNVVFMVFDDEALTWPQIGYNIPGILGFPLVEAVGEVRFRRGDVLEIPASAGMYDTANLVLEGLAPRVLTRIQSGNGTFAADSVLCALDTGAKSTSLLAPFYRRYKAGVEEIGRPEEVAIGGAGGVSIQDGFVMPSLTLTIGTHSASIDSVRVHTQTTFESPESQIGCNIGQDVIGQFDETVLNFRSMSLLFR